MTTIHFTGNLTRDPELRYTPAGKPVANLVVAENHRVRDNDGSWSDGPTTFWPVTVWGEPAEHVTETLTRGDRVVVVGRSGTRTWTPSDGANVGHEQRRLEVVAEEVAPSLRWVTATLIKTNPTDAPEPPRRAQRVRASRPSEFESAAGDPGTAPQCAGVRGARARGCRGGGPGARPGGVAGRVGVGAP